MATIHNKTNFRLMRLASELRGFRLDADAKDQEVLQQILHKLDEILDLAARLRKPGEPRK